MEYEYKKFFEKIELEIIFKEKPIFETDKVDLHKIRREANKLLLLTKIGHVLKKTLNKQIKRPRDLPEISNWIGAELMIHDSPHDGYADGSRNYVLFWTEIRYSNGDFCQTSKKVGLDSVNNSNWKKLTRKISEELENWLSRLYRKVRCRKNNLLTKKGVFELVTG